MDTNYLNLVEASEYTRISRASLYSYIAQKRIPFIKVARKVLFDKTDLDKWLNAKKKQEETE